MPPSYLVNARGEAPLNVLLEPRRDVIHISAKFVEDVGEGTLDDLANGRTVISVQHLVGQKLGSYSVK